MEPNECLRNAEECTERAGRAATEETKAELLLIATEWMRLAKELTAIETQAADDARKRGA